MNTDGALRRSGFETSFFRRVLWGMKYVLICSFNMDGIVLARSPDGANKIFLSGNPSWESLSEAQKDSVCKIVWAVESGEFEIRDARTREMMSSHNIGW